MNPPPFWLLCRCWSKKEVISSKTNALLKLSSWASSFWAIEDIVLMSNFSKFKVKSSRVMSFHSSSQIVSLSSLKPNMYCTCNGVKVFTSPLMLKVKLYRSNASNIQIHILLLRVRQLYLSKHPNPIDWRTFFFSCEKLRTNVKIPSMSQYAEKPS